LQIDSRIKNYLELILLNEKGRNIKRGPMEHAYPGQEKRPNEVDSSESYRVHNTPEE
jgi:hypothetical protein